jgi:hypothetical protein
VLRFKVISGIAVVTASGEIMPLVVIPLLRTHRPKTEVQETRVTKFKWLLCGGHHRDSLLDLYEGA